MRFDVRSADGTPIAVWVDGEGPALVMVHGSIADHTTFASLVAALRDDVTTYALDRRGFAASGDGPFSLEVEFDDVAAVVDSVAARTGGPVALWGHSYGCNPAMGAATRTANVSHLVLYEPSLGLTYPEGSIEAAEAALDTGDREAALEVILAGILEMSDDEIDGFRSSPLWLTRVDAAHTVPRECRVERDWVYAGGSSTPSRPRPWSSRAPTRSRRSWTRPGWPRTRSPAVGSTSWTATATSPTGRTRGWWRASCGTSWTRSGRGGGEELTEVVYRSGRGDLNPRPPAPKAGALPLRHSPEVPPERTRRDHDAELSAWPAAGWPHDASPSTASS